MIPRATVEQNRYTLQLIGNSTRPVCVRHVRDLNHNGYGRYMGDKSMTETAVTHKSDCGDPQHGKHLCFLMYEGFISRIEKRTRNWFKKLSFAASSAGAPRAAETAFACPRPCNRRSVARIMATF